MYITLYFMKNIFCNLLFFLFKMVPIIRIKRELYLHDAPWQSK